MVGFPHSRNSASIFFNYTTSVLNIFATSVRQGFPIRYFGRSNTSSAVSKTIEEAEAAPSPGRDENSNETQTCHGT